jgi:hypothetical protein
MTDPRDHVPAFSTDVEPTDVAADGASAQLDAFVSANGVAEPDRHIDQGTIQVLLTRDLASPDAVADVRMRLADTAAVCDDFAIHRAGDGATIEVWACFAL